ncbi:unnamed protein product, partial [Heterotrigona itama]
NFYARMAPYLAIDNLRFIHLTWKDTVSDKGRHNYVWIVIGHDRI